MRVKYEPEAEQELDSAFDYYLIDASEAAAERLLTEVRAAEQQILQFPNAQPKAGRGARRCLLRRFPYQLVYRAEAGIVRIFAVAHLKRRPGYWRRRVRPE